MNESRTQRKLAAIFAADVVGYSRLIRADEEGTLRRLRLVQSDIIDPRIAEYSGRVVKLMGDGVLAEFPSVVDAVRAGSEIQRAIVEQNEPVPTSDRIEFRIGINLGDIIIDGDDIQGDGVNVAARLEGIAPAGGICISGGVYEQIRDRVALNFEDMGDQSVKNMNRPIRVWRWTGTSDQKDRKSQEISGPPQTSNKPSVAVLPFDNMSGNPSEDYFADGISEDIITALSKHRWLNVTARNTTFGYRGKSPDLKKLGAELGVGYFVKGSVRRAGARIRVTAQLIDASTGTHLWAEKYDGGVEDIFDVQDEITRTIAAHVEPEVGLAERQKAARKPSTNLKAWDCYHLGIAHFYKFTAKDNLEAQRLLAQSRQLDPSFGEAHAWWAYAAVLGMVYWDTDPDQALLDEALSAAQTALEIDDQNAVFYTLMGRVQLARREYSSALNESEIAIKLNPSSAVAYCGLGDSLSYEGRYDEAVKWFEKAVAISSNDPQRWAFLSYGALALLFKRDFETALSWTEKASVIPNCQYWATAHKIVALAHLGREGDARHEVERLLVQEPRFTITFARKKLFYLKLPEQIELYLEGLSLAGVAEE